MTITIRSFFPYGAGDTSSPMSQPRNGVDIHKLPNSAAAQLFRADISQPAPVTGDLNSGISQSPADSFLPQTVNGTARAVPGGKDVVVNCSASDRGTLVIEESSNGTSGWTNAQFFPMHAAQILGVRFQASLGYYRASFTAAGGESVKKVHVSSQVRDVGV